MTPRIPFPFSVVLVCLTGGALLACGSSGNSSALENPGTSDVVITPIGMHARAQAVAIQSDGKIVAAGTSYTGTQNVFALARYSDADGSLDAGFGTAGVVMTPIGAVDDKAQALVIQPSDGKLVAAGFAFVGGQYRIAVARYINDGVTDGDLDASFGTGGIVTTAIGSVDDRAFAVAIQSDAGEDKIVVAGYSSDMNGGSIRSRLVVVRYHPDGTLDNSFDTDGIAIFDASTYVSSTDAAAAIFSAGAFALAVQLDAGEEKLVAAGFAYMSVTDGNKLRQQDAFLLVRYHPDGSPDDTLNGGDGANTSGAVTTVINKVNDQAYAVAVQPSDGRIVVAGSSYTTGQSVMALVRYTTAGSLDTDFNGTGKATAQILSDAIAFALAIQTDGKLLIAGSAYNKTYAEFVLARFNTGGGSDGTFGSGGKVHTAITFGAEAFGLAIQGDGKPVAAGYSQAQTEPEKFTLVRYETNGDLDPAFVTP